MVRETRPIVTFILTLYIAACSSAKKVLPTYHTIWNHIQDCRTISFKYLQNCIYESSWNHGKKNNLHTRKTRKPGFWNHTCSLQYTRIHVHALYYQHTVQQDIRACIVLPTHRTTSFTCPNIRD